MIRSRLSVCACIALASLAATAQAAPQFEFSLSGSFNTPTLTLTNNSDTEIISSFKLFIGDSSRNFDYVSQEQVTGSFTWDRVMPDDIGGNGTRSDFIVYNFTDFGPGESFNFQADIDVDPDLSLIQDYRTVLFDMNGSDDSDNAILWVEYDDSQLIKRLPDFAANDQNVYSVYLGDESGNGGGSAIPTPGAFAGGLMLLGSVCMRRNRRSM